MYKVHNRLLALVTDGAPVKSFDRQGQLHLCSKVDVEGGSSGRHCEIE